MREKRFGFVFWLAVLACYCQSSSNSEEDGDKSRQTFVIRYKDGEQTIPVTVVLDYRKQTEYVINMNPRTPAKSVTLYDFKQRTIAYKDLTNRECFLGRLTHETLNEESSALQDVKNPVEVRPKVRSLDPRMPALTPTEIRNIAGQKTAVFCRKMNTWLLMPEKAHGISKREVGSFEERTLQYHGHRSSQYSHYEQETRRRFRNRGHPNHRRRSHRRESAAENTNGRLPVSEPTTLPQHFNNHHSNNVYFNPQRSSSIIDVRRQNHSSTYRASRYPYSFPERSTRVEKENVNKAVPFANGFSSGRSNNIHNDFRYPESETKFRSSEGVAVHSKTFPNVSRYSNSYETDGTPILEHEIISDSSTHTVNRFGENNHFARLVSDDTDSEAEVKITTTENSIVPFQQGVNYPNVHSSLVHLLPLYKPLGQEFDFDEAKTADRSNNELSIQQKEIESEIHSLPTALTEPINKFTHLTDVSNTSHDSDVSVNVLEIPKITKRFENVQNNNSYVSVSEPEINRRSHSSVDSYSSLSQTHSNGSPLFHRSIPHNISSIHPEYLPASSNADIVSNSAKETYFNPENINLPQLDISTTTGLPVLTTREHFSPERTTPDDSYVPSVHTAFQNLEDLNSFQIFPNYLENDIDRLPTEKSSNIGSIHDNSDKVTEAVTDRILQHSVLTTEHPLIEIKHKVDSRHRSDIPSEDSHSQSQPFSHSETKLQSSFYPFFPNNRTDETLTPHKIRYQNALRDFKPDEIVIDIENIPTHTPPPITDSFHQRTLTTVRPTIKSLSADAVQSGSSRRSEQTSGTTWRSSIPTTRYPRRRIIEKSRRPVQSGSVPVSARGSLNQNHPQLLKTPTEINQLVGVNRLSSPHYANRRQFHYPSRPIPPSHARMPTEMNQLHHISHLNNLPPGVSVHPRHPQAPFADMVRSNRPPTMPILGNNQEHLKPHRQRHQRKKDRHLNSCCRLRGKAGAFQTCCKNGGPCCSRSRRRMQPPGAPCCSSSKSVGQIIPANQIQPPVRTMNKILPPIRTEDTHRSEVDNKDRCQKEKMCRTLYESTQQVMVCRNAHIEGC